MFRGRENRGFDRTFIPLHPIEKELHHSVRWVSCNLAPEEKVTKLFGTLLFPDPEVKEEDTKSPLPDPPSSHSYLEIASLSAMSLIQHLQENNQYEIAMKVLLVSLGSCLQHFVTNTCRIELCDKVWCTWLFCRDCILRDYYQSQMEAKPFDC